MLILKHIIDAKDTAAPPKHGIEMTLELLKHLAFVVRAKTISCVKLIVKPLASSTKSVIRIVLLIARSMSTFTVSIQKKQWSTLSEFSSSMPILSNLSMPSQAQATIPRTEKTRWGKQFETS